MAKYVQTSDGIMHKLPDTVTDANYELEKQTFLDSYNPTPTPDPEVTELIAGGMSQAEADTLITSRASHAPLKQEVNRLFGKNSQVSGSFSREFVEQPATYDFLNNAQAEASVKKQINDLKLLQVLDQPT